MRTCAFAIAAALAFAAATAHGPAASAMGRPGLNPVPCPDQSWQKGDPAFDALPGAKAFFGEYSGGIYRIEIPDKWNGELVLYAHGFVSNAGANGSMLRAQNDTIRDHLIQQGFAWAASSYRCNGYVPGIGLLDTMALSDLFVNANGGRAPQRTYLTGVSMGGHVTLLGMQEFPTAFAGGLAMCPAGPELFDFYGASSAAAEVVSGVRFHPDSLQQDLAKMNEILGAPPNYTEKGRQLASIEIQISGGPRPFAVEGLASRFAANYGTSPAALDNPTTPVNRALTNTHITYAIDEGLGLSAADINGAVRRKPADPAIRNPNGPYEEVVPFDGKFERPVLTMHGTGDLFVPIFLEQTLKRAVAAAGNDRLLVQRIYRIAGHCQFSQAEQIKAFDDLVAWVRDGVRPEGDDVLGDLSDAGRRFTNPLRPNDPGGLRMTATPPSQGAEAAAMAKVDFARDVQPIFRQKCVGCHGPTVHQNGLRLDRRSSAMRGGTIAVIGPGNSAGSRLYLMLAPNPFGPQMPPTGPLSAGEIATIKAWIDEGAPWPDALANEAPARAADPAAQQLIAAIRSGNRTQFAAALASRPDAANLPGPGGSTPLMYAALQGDAQSIRELLRRGADPNARNDAGATALMWATHDAESTRLLLEYGADVSARSDDGRTAIVTAAGRYGSAPVIRQLLDYGADPSDTGPQTNVLFEAAFVGDEPVVGMLLDAGARVNDGFGIVVYGVRVCRPCAERLIATMDRTQISKAMLFAGPPNGDGADTEFFLDHGADVNATNDDGFTALMLAAASDGIPARVAQRLIERGAKVNAAMPDGRTALDFARLRGRTTIVDLLTKAGATPGKDAPAGAVVPAPAPSPRAAVERSLPLLQASDAAFLKKSGCVSCHNNSVTAMAVSLARSAGIRVDEEIAQQQVDAIGRYVESWSERLLQGTGIPGAGDTVGYILLGISAEGYPASEATDAMVRYLARQQRPTGEWRALDHRPPIQPSSDIQVTATALRALRVYAPRYAKAEYDQRIRRAAAWLAAAHPATTQDRAFQLLGLTWSQQGRAPIKAAARGLLGTQRNDGGWSQLPTLESDAYATGQALVALLQSDAATPADPAVMRAVRFLQNTQGADGAWYVRSRSIPIQPLFDAGFPFGREQFLSVAATGWATMALALSAR